LVKAKKSLALGNTFRNTDFLWDNFRFLRASPAFITIKNN